MESHLLQIKETHILQFCNLRPIVIHQIKDLWQILLEVDFSPFPIFTHSLEAKHLILVWIMKVKGPKNQADFIEVPPKDENYT